MPTARQAIGQALAREPDNPQYRRLYASISNQTVTKPPGEPLAVGDRRAGDRGDRGARVLGGGKLLLHSPPHGRRQAVVLAPLDRSSCAPGAGSICKT